MCVCVSETLGGHPLGMPAERSSMPEGACPKGAPRRGPEEATATAGRQGVLERGRGGSPGPPQKMFLLICKKNMCMHKFPPKGQLRLPGGLEGCLHLQKIYRQSFFFSKNLPRRCKCSRRPPEDARGGGGPPLPKKRRGAKRNTVLIILI